MNKILETPRLFLREMTADDFDALYCVLADPGIMQHYPYAFDEERVRDWISRNIARYQRNGFGLWAVCLKDTGEMIGDCGLTLQKYTNEPSIRTAEAIGMHFDREYPDEANGITHVSVIHRNEIGTR